MSVLNLLAATQPTGMKPSLFILVSTAFELFFSEYAISKIQENQAGLEWNTSDSGVS
jgi:hypothetical protein